MKMFNPRHISLILLLLSSGNLLPGSVAICYYPSGDVAPQDLPCRDDTGESGCCGPAYACLSNGICMSTGFERQLGNQAQYVRGSCTDRAWRSSRCPSFCVNPDNNDKLDGGIGLRKCPDRQDDTYYCDDGADFDCDTLDNVLSFQGTPTALTTIGVEETTSTVSKSVTSTSKRTSQASETPESSGTAANKDDDAAATDSESSEERPAQDGGHSSQRDVSIGLGVGITVVALGLVAAGVAFWWLRRRRRAGQSAAMNTAAMTATQLHSAPNMSSQSSVYPCHYEVPSNGKPRQTVHSMSLWQQPQPVELPGEPVNKVYQPPS